MTRYYVLFFFLVLAIPLLWGINTWQANKCGKLRNDIRFIEKEQEDSMKENRAIANDILNILAVENLETKAQDMGLRKMGPEDVTVIIVGGLERGY